MSIISASSDYKIMKFSLLELSEHDASNGGIQMSLTLIDEKLFVFYILITFQNILLSIGPRDIQTKELYFILL